MNPQGPLALLMLEVRRWCMTLGVGALALLFFLVPAAGVLADPVAGLDAGWLTRSLFALVLIVGLPLVACGFGGMALRRGLEPVWLCAPLNRMRLVTMRFAVLVMVLVLLATSAVCGAYAALLAQGTDQLTPYASPQPKSLGGHFSIDGQRAAAWLDRQQGHQLSFTLPNHDTAPRQLTITYALAIGTASLGKEPDASTSDREPAPPLILRYRQLNGHLVELAPATQRNRELRYMLPAEASFIELVPGRSDVVVGMRFADIRVSGQAQSSLWSLMTLAGAVLMGAVALLALGMLLGSLFSWGTAFAGSLAGFALGFFSSSLGVLAPSHRMYLEQMQPYAAASDARSGIIVQVLGWLPDLSFSSARRGFVSGECGDASQTLHQLWVMPVLALAALVLGGLLMQLREFGGDEDE